MNQNHCINNRLYYTVESILSELAALICHTKNMPDVIAEFYIELQKMSMDLGAIVQTTELTPNEAAAEFNSMYQDILDVYIDHLEEESRQFI